MWNYGERLGSAPALILLTHNPPNLLLAHVRASLIGCQLGFKVVDASSTISYLKPGGRRVRRPNWGRRTRDVVYCRLQLSQVHL